MSIILNAYWCPNCETLSAREDDTRACRHCTDNVDGGKVEPVTLGVGPDSNELKIFRVEKERS